MTTETPEIKKAQFRDVEVEETDADTYEADRRLVGTATVENTATKPIYVRRVWLVDEGEEDEGGSTVHESTHYYAAHEPTESAHVADSVGVEWSTENTGDALLEELRENLTNDAYAEVEAVLDEAGRKGRRKLGVGNQGGSA
jgi:hypothetical protein